MEGKKYYLSVGEHTYEVTRGYVDKCIEMAKEAMRPISDWAIVALGKDNIILMSKETFKDEKSFNKAVTAYIVKGFKVHEFRRSFKQKLQYASQK